MFFWEIPTLNLKFASYRLREMIALFPITLMKILNGEDKNSKISLKYLANLLLHHVILNSNA